MAVTGKPSQDFIPIKDIRSGVMVLNNGDLRMITHDLTLNFGLKSTDEQAAIIIQFQNFLNSLEYPIQIFIQSKRLDIRPYLQMLEEREKVQLSDAMKIQVHEYIGFIKEFTGRTNIMSKTFFIVVPYAARIRLGQSGGDSGGGLLGKIMPGGKKGATRKPSAEEMQNFEEARMQLEQRVSIVEQGLGRCDIRTTRLGTEEITELL